MKIVIYLFISLLVLIGFYFCYQAFFSLAPNQPQSTSLNNAGSTPTTASTQNFTHAVLGYTFRFPANWQEIVHPIPPGAKQKYEDVSVRTLDYKISDGYPVMESGAEFWIHAVETDKTNIDEQFNNESPLVKQLAQNKISAIVDGQAAIQYNYSYEGTMATQTIFIKNGLFYTLRFRYPDETAKNSFWPDYLNFLASF